MGLKTLSQTRGLFKAPQLLHKWEIEIPTWPKAVSPSNKDVTFLVTTSELPTSTVNDVDVKLGGYPMSYNGKEERAGSVNWDFLENTDKLVTDYFLIAYPNKRQDHSSISNVSLKSSTEEDLICPIVKMKLYDSTGTNVKTTYTLVNCKFKPTSSLGSLGQDADNAKLTVAVTYDTFIVT